MALANGGTEVPSPRYIVCVPLLLVLNLAFLIILEARPMVEFMGRPSMPIPGADRRVVLAAAFHPASVVLITLPTAKSLR